MSKAPDRIARYNSTRVHDGQKRVEYDDDPAMAGYDGDVYVRADLYDMVVEQRDGWREREQAAAATVRALQEILAAERNVSAAVIGMLNSVLPPDEKRLLVSFAEVRPRFKAALAKATAENPAPTARPAEG